MVVAYCATLPFSIAHLDLARDIAQAVEIFRGTAFPLEGPVLGGAIHAGPVWFYLLSLPLAISPSWLAVAIFIGLIAALKFPLAYALGGRLADRETGLLWAMLLLFPGWMTMESILQNHASLVATCTLAFLLTLTAYARSGLRRYLAGAGLLFALALHAHPSTIGLALLLIAAIAYRAWRSSTLPVADLLLVAVSVLVPFAPYLISQLVSGGTDLDRAMSFIQDSASIGSPRNLWPVLVGTAYGGTRFVAETFWSPNPAAVIAAVSLGGAVLLCGIVGLALEWQRRGRRALLAGAALATLAIALSVAVIRLLTPFYMTFVIWVLLTGLIAIGLRAGSGARALRWPIRLVTALAIAAIGVTQVSVARTIDRGDYAFSFFPLLDVQQPHQRGTPMPFVPARALGRNGKRLCSEPAVAAHGSLAVHLLHDYALEARLACDRASHITLGGAAATNLVGVSRPIQRVLGAPGDSRLGPIRLFPAAQVIHPRTGAPIPDPAKYPPVAGAYGDGTTHTLSFAAARDEAILVTDAFFAFGSPPRVVARANGERLEAVARDLVSSAYICMRCSPSEPVRWQLDIGTPAIDRVDVVTFHLTGSNRR